METLPKKKYSFRPENLAIISSLLNSLVCTFLLEMFCRIKAALCGRLQRSGFDLHNFRGALIGLQCILPQRLSVIVFHYYSHTQGEEMGDCRRHVSSHL